MYSLPAPDFSKDSYTPNAPADDSEPLVYGPRGECDSCGELMELNEHRLCKTCNDDGEAEKLAVGKAMMEGKPRNATGWLTSARVNAWCDKQSKFRKMTAQEYAAQLTDLIEYAGEMLSEAEAQKVQLDAFNLLRTRLGVKIESKLVIRGAS